MRSESADTTLIIARPIPVTITQAYRDLVLSPSNVRFLYIGLKFYSESAYHVLQSTSLCLLPIMCDQSLFSMIRRYFDLDCGAYSTFNAVKLFDIIVVALSFLLYPFLLCNHLTTQFESQAGITNERLLQSTRLSLVSSFSQVSELQDFTASELIGPHYLYMICLIVSPLAKL